MSGSCKVWSNMKSFLGLSSGGPPSKLLQNGTLYNKPKDLAKVMNNFFIKKVTDLRRGIPATVGDPLDQVRNLMRNRKCSFKLQPCHPDEVMAIIKKLNKHSKSCGIDNIDT